MILSYSRYLKNEINELGKNPKSEIKSCTTWLQDKDQFVSLIKEYKSNNEIIRRNSSKSKSAFIITGTTIGLGGGIYGLFANSEPKGAAITSMVTGALTALVGSLNIERKSERSNACSDFLNGILLDFDIYWGIARCPTNNKELEGYLKSKDSVIESLKSMKCYGLPLPTE